MMMPRFGAGGLLLSVIYISLLSALTTSLDTGKAACRDLERSFRRINFMPTEPGYEHLRTKNWAQTAQGSPTCIFQPTDVEELQAAVPLLVSANVSLAIRSGGHSPLPNAASIDNGVLIDMSRFNHITYDPTENVATVGTGLTWGEVYTYLDQYQVTVVGGRVPIVGVGGLLLGGGLSYLSDLYGLGCDNVVNYEVVLANGSVVHANAESNSDLFWALKGGANNFGLVTSFSLATHPIYEVWGGIKYYRLEDLPALLDANQEYQSVGHKDPYANLMIQGFPTNSGLGIILNIVYLKPETNPAAFAPFYHISTINDTTKVRTFSDFSLAAATIEVQRFDWRTTSFIPSKAIYDDLKGILSASPQIEEIQSVPGGLLAFGIQPISSSAVAAGHARGGNALSLEARNQTWFVFDSGWESQSDDAKVHRATRAIMDEVDEAVSRAGDDHVRYLFMNDASYDQDVLASYGEEAVGKLREVAARYDPGSVFQRLVPGYFKLP